MTRISKAILLGLMAVVISSCDVSGVLDEDLDVVVESYLVAGEALPSVRLSRTASIGATYSFANRAISGAEVEITLIGQNESANKTFPYAEIPGRPGNYLPVEPDLVLPLREYQLRVIVPGRDRQIQATTLVPGTFEVVREGLDEVRYQGETQFQVGVTRSEYPGRQSIFIFTVDALDPKPENLTPFYREIVDPDDPDSGENIEDFMSIESNVVNELNYDILDDGTLTVKLPWFAVAFYGPHIITVSAIDNNLYDFLRSHAVQQGGSTLSPGEIPNPIHRIDGGAGVFGSLSRISRETVVVP